jgi:hypothetical protein
MSTVFVGAKNVAGTIRNRPSLMAAQMGGDDQIN